MVRNSGRAPLVSVSCKKLSLATICVGLLNGARLQLEIRKTKNLAQIETLNLKFALTRETVRCLNQVPNLRLIRISTRELGDRTNRLRRFRYWTNLNISQTASLRCKPIR